MTDIRIAHRPTEGTTDGGIGIPGWYRRAFPNSPARIALLWAAATIIGIAEHICFPGDGANLVTAGLYLAGTPIFAGLLAAWGMRLRGAALHLISAFASLGLATGLLAFLMKLDAPPVLDGVIDGIRFCLTVAGSIYLVEAGYRPVRSRRRRLSAILLAALPLFGANALAGSDYRFWAVSEAIRPLIGRADPPETRSRAPDIEPDLLWGAQPALIAKQAAAFQPRAADAANVYAVAVAGSGAQDLFGREAHAALRAAAAHFGTADRGGALLSNAADDQMHVPLATRDNIAAMTRTLADRADRAHDLVFLYLASHGSRDAELASDLSDYQSVQTISATSTAAALNAAGFKRRIIVISACYAGTWIPPLADDDTIVITAAAKDRTSFGCDDSRQLTFFGEAFLGSLSSPKISLRDAFEEARRKIAAKERSGRMLPSLPQVQVGRNMQAVWRERPVR
ncbi:C13 family peptidase [Sphingomonas immobilis]|uniref:C13 family peptidase n=1 Tax=Sphingomonas immobilis TaxID=3063997 RepID=A0ABT9A524_9SPHN|nr:C13 family peptidase [Sphingomonas sp. CA1-15]MDO7844444.1 C13 family peptidase [Sphingomonas sp. CA1-15]